MQLLLEERREPRLRRDQVWSWVAVAVASVCAAMLGLAVGAKPVFAVTPVIVALPVILWRKPHLAIVVLIAGSTLIETALTPVGTHSGPITADLPWWRSVTHGMILFPVEIFILLALLIWVLKLGLDRSYRVPKSPLTTCFKAFWVFLLLAIAIGLIHGAQLKYNLWEARPWIYVTVGFVLAAALLQTRKALDAVLWAFVIGTGLKGVEGTHIFFAYARAMNPRPEEILGHEEAFFMGIFITITALLWLYGHRGALRRTAMAFLPFVVIADMANARRTAWLVLALSLAFMLIIGYRTLPHRRRFIRRGVLALALGCAVYLPAYWHHDGTLAEPAQAVRSAVEPNSSARDQSSDLYRLEEDWNLITNIKSHGLEGAGFGIPIEYSGIANISNIDPLIAYIPHNGLLWIWLRMGLQGEAAFWCLIAVAVIRACRLARAPDLRLAMFGTLTACATAAYLADGYEDMGFANFREALAIGLLIGVMEAATRLARAHAANGDVAERNANVDRYASVNLALLDGREAGPAGRLLSPLCVSPRS